MRLVVGVLGVLLSLGAASAVPAQDIEPNDTCRSSSRVSLARMPEALTGSLDVRNASASGDIDFFVLSWAPWGRVFASNTSPVRVAVLDRDCQQIALSERGKGVAFQMPADGVVLIAIDDALDPELDSRPRAGSVAYRLGLFWMPPPVCSGPGSDGCRPSP